MNLKQRIAIGIGIALVALSGLFLPYEGEDYSGYGGFKRRAYLGYCFILTPPEPKDIGAAFGMSPPPGYFGADIIISLIVVQMSTIVLVTVGLFLLLADRKILPEK
jgi:hypothetical protein